MSETASLGFSLSQFRLDKVLNQDSISKSCVLLGTFTSDNGSDNGENKRCIIILERQMFPEPEMDQLFDGTMKSDVVFHNDIYTSLNLFLTNEKLNCISSRVIYPADDSHIKKYSAEAGEQYEETIEIYEKVVLPYIKSIPPSRIQWVSNIVEGKSEVERVIYKCEDFVLLPDFKWEDGNTDHLYCLAIFSDPALQSIRDLTGNHLGLLNRVKSEAELAISKKYQGVEKKDLIMFFHYLPTYYRLHIHIIKAGHVVRGANVGKAHLLSSVMENLRLCPTYYQQATLGYIINPSNPLYTNLGLK